MRRLTPALLISLLCNAGAFAIENPVKSSAEIPRNALFDQLIGTWDVPYEYLDKKGNPKSNQGPGALRLDPSRQSSPRDLEFELGQ